MVMELLEGENLGQRIKQMGPLHPAEAIHIGDQICDALGAVHAKKILHRDLKPENVFLVKKEGEGEGEGDQSIKLLDFGIARTLGVGRRRRTDPGSAVGTPEYMAPEQVLEQELDERSDIYAMGLLLYEMLSGTVPFKAGSYGELMIMQVKELPEPLSLRRTVKPPLSPALERVVMRCLEKERDKRFQTMGLLREALVSAGYAADRSTHVVSGAAPSRRWSVPLIILGALLLFGGGAATWGLLSRSGSSASTPRETAAPPVKSTVDRPAASKPALAAEPPAADAGSKATTAKVTAKATAKATASPVVPALVDTTDVAALEEAARRAEALEAKAQRETAAAMATKARKAAARKAAARKARRAARRGRRAARAKKRSAPKPAPKKKRRAGDREGTVDPFSL
jgi:hypothetical protein